MVKMLKKKFLILMSIILILEISLFFAQGNESVDLNNSYNNANINNFSNDSALKSRIEIIKFFPKEFKLGDAQFNIQVKNNLNETFEGVVASISGKGFSTYGVVPIDLLGPFEKDYIFVNGNFKEVGALNLSIRIKNDFFNQEVNVVDVNAGKDVEELKKQEKIERLENLSKELDILKQNYTNLEIELSEKKNNNYDVSKISLDDLKKYIRSIETDILYENADSAEISLKIAKEEFEYQNTKLSNAQVIPLVTRLKDNALIVSAIVGAILATVALTDIVKRQSSHVINSVGRIKKKKVLRRK